jgi:hypothetical protein
MNQPPAPPWAQELLNIVENISHRLNQIEEQLYTSTINQSIIIERIGAKKRKKLSKYMTAAEYIQEHNLEVDLKYKLGVWAARFSKQEGVRIKRDNGVNIYRDDMLEKAHKYLKEF